MRLFALMMRRVMRASGAESLNVAASIFMGQTEAPLTIRPFLPRMTESELMTVMTSGMAHISGGIMAAYILFGIEAQHLLTAVIMTAPGTLMMAKIFVPETEQPDTMGTVKLNVERTDVNVIDAAGRGTSEGLALALNVGAMLISFLALVALVNAILGLAGLSLQQIFGWVFAPIAWSMGVPWRDAPTIGNLLGTRMALNEFVAYSQLGPLKASLDPRSFTIATFALCGFANFSSIGIQIGGIGALAPDSPSRPGPPRLPRDARRHPGQFRHRHHRRVPAVTGTLNRDSPRGHSRLTVPGHKVLLQGGCARVPRQKCHGTFAGVPSETPGAKDSRGLSWLSVPDDIFRQRAAGGGVDPGAERRRP